MSAEFPNSDDPNEPRPCCLELRCKSMFYRADERPGLIHHNEANDYWCHETNKSIGPDGEPVGHTKCDGKNGRGCFIPPKDPSRKVIA